MRQHILQDDSHSLLRGIYQYNACLLAGKGKRKGELDDDVDQINTRNRATRR